VSRSTGGVSPSVRPQSDRAADDLDGSDRPGTEPDATAAGSRADQASAAPEGRPDPARSRPYPDGAVAGLDAWNPALEHRNRRVALAPEPSGNAIPAQPRGSFASGPHPRPAEGYGAPGSGGASAALPHGPVPGSGAPDDRGRPAPARPEAGGTPSDRPAPGSSSGSARPVTGASGPERSGSGRAGGGSVPETGPRPTPRPEPTAGPGPAAAVARTGGAAPAAPAPAVDPTSGDRTVGDRDATAATGGRAARRARRAVEEPADDSGAGWLQAEIARRVADRAGGTGRHARVDPAGTRPRDSGQPDHHDAPAPDHGDPPRGAAARGVANPAGTAGAAAPSPAALAPADPRPQDDTRHDGAPRDDVRTPDVRTPDVRDPDARDSDAPDDPDACESDVRPLQPTRSRPARTRANLVPDPYAPEGVRPGDGWSSAPGVTPAPGVADSGKQWPPSSGGSGLPQRVPGATSWSNTWSPDRSALLAGTTDTTGAPGTAGATGTAGVTDSATGTDTARGPDTADTHGTADAGIPARTGTGDTTVVAPADRPRPEESPETRPVPTRWSAAGRRGPVAPVPYRLADSADRADDELDDDLPDEDELDELRGGPLERTEVIWRAPEVDVVAPAPEPSVEPGPEPFAPAAAAPYTGARPRPFSAEPTDPPAAVEELDDADGAGPGAGRVRVVLSERRSTAQSSRGLSDVQDPGAVGTLLRNSLVRTQLLLALRVSVVALIGLGVLPALFIAVPVIGQVEVLGIRLPWLLLGVLVYPFLLGLGWWYVSSAEAAEQDFADDVADR
jgi:hypothetical protein